MSSPAASDDPASDGIPEHLVQVGVYPTLDDAATHGLVVLAMGHAYWLMPADHAYRLLVEPGAAGDAREQLARFERESVNWPPRPLADPGPRHRADLTTPLLWAAAVLLVFQGQATHPEWVEKGALDAAGVFERGEWWRLATALFLHADGPHVLSNTIGGIFVFSAVLSTFGLARGWMLLAVASLAGNLLAAWVRQPAGYRSVGASTAVFAAVGLLTGRAIRVALHSRHPHRWRSLLVPFGSGVAILALYGAGGVRVDVMAHLTGFIAGLACGFAAAGGGPARASADAAAHRHDARIS
jgi:rhomboid protease GluP